MGELKKHLLFDKRSANYAKFGRRTDTKWIIAYPRTLCWVSIKGLEFVENVEDATCKKCLKSAHLQFAPNTH